MSWKMSGRVKEIRSGMNSQPITRTDKLVLLILADYYNEKTKTSWPSLDTLAEECLCSKVSLWRSLSRLEKIGLLESKVGRWKEPEYSLLPSGDPPSHFNLKYESHFKTSDITFQNQGAQISNEAKLEGVSIKNQVLARKEPKESKGNSLPLSTEPKNWKQVEEDNAQFHQRREERRARRGRGGFQQKRPNPVSNSSVRVAKQPESWLWFSSLFQRMADKPVFNHPDLWLMADEMISDIGREQTEERLSIYLDGIQSVTSYASRDFLTGGWRTVDPEDHRMPRIVNED